MASKCRVANSCDCSIMRTVRGWSSMPVLSRGKLFRIQILGLPVMRKDWELTKEDFDRFLTWLHPDREQAGQKYEEIRRRLVIIFNARRCPEAEDLADETINRVIRRAQKMADT